MDDGRLYRAVCRRFAAKFAADPPSIFAATCAVRPSEDSSSLARSWHTSLVPTALPDDAAADRVFSAEELARLQGVAPVESADALKIDVWDDDDVDAFIESVRSARRANVA